MQEFYMESASCMCWTGEVLVASVGQGICQLLVLDKKVLDKCWTMKLLVESVGQGKFQLQVLCRESDSCKCWKGKLIVACVGQEKKLVSSDRQGQCQLQVFDMAIASFKF